VALGIFIPLAWNLLRLRFLSRAAPDAPAATVLTPTQLAVLRTHPRVELTDEPTVREALLAVAKLGGHIRNNGDPGWLVLGRLTAVTVTATASRSTIRGSPSTGASGARPMPPRSRRSFCPRPRFAPRDRPVDSPVPDD